MKRIADRMRLLVASLIGVLVVLAPGERSHGQQGLSGVEIAELAGTTTSQRVNMICTLAPRARDGLSALETAVALGSLSGVYRLKALTCLAPHVQLNLTGVEVAQIVGAGQSFRADMACRIADHVRPNLPSAEADAILEELSGVYRLKALKCLEPRLAGSLAGSDLAQVVGEGLSFRKDMLCAVASHAASQMASNQMALALGGLSGVYRFQAVKCLEPRVASELTGEDLVRIVGQGLSFRKDMLCAVASHAGAAMASDQVALALGGLSGIYRLQAIKCLEPRAAAGLTGEDLARVVGPGTSFRKDMLCALAGHIDGIMPADEMAQALGDLTGVYRLQAIQCLEPSALAVTDRLLSPADNPLRQDPSIAFAPGQVWRGQYQCSNRVADLELSIQSVRSSPTAPQDGSRYQIAAVFNFRYRDDASAGAFNVTGDYNIDNRSTRFVAGNWIERPSGYRTVNMDGLLSEDRTTYSGRIVSTNCQSFTVSLYGEVRQPPESYGVCGSTDGERVLVPDYVCFSMYGGTLPWVPLCSVSIVTGYWPVYFGEACRTHDSCYGRAGSVKSQCDSQFRDLLNMTCDESLRGSVWELGRRNCHNAVDEYYHQVLTQGCDPFIDAQAAAGNAGATCN